MFSRRLLISLGVTMAACSSHSAPPTPVLPVMTPDSPPEAYEWLEDVHGDQALAWVRAHNDKTLARLKAHPLYNTVEAEIRKIVLAQDRIPYPHLLGDALYNFWQDDKHVRGLWRRTTLEGYAQKEIPWETVLDLDLLASRENENWVWKGSQCLPEKTSSGGVEYTRCLLTLSRGGTDASVVREFDLRTKAFVPGGFEVPAAKSAVSWVNRDTLFLGTDFGPVPGAHGTESSLTKAGYPRILRLWKRGTPLASAETIFAGEVDDVSVSSQTSFGTLNPATNEDLHIVSRAPSFFEESHYIWRDAPSSSAATGGASPALRGQLTPIAVPKDASFVEAFDGRLFFTLRSAWQPGRLVFAEGTLVSVPLEKDAHGNARAAIEKTELVFNPGMRGSVQSVSAGRHWLYIQTVEDVKGRLLVAKHTKDSGWSTRALPFPDHGTVALVSTSPYSDKHLTNFESFLVPAGLYVGDGEGRPTVLKQAPERFDAKPYEVRQEFAKSTDGERIPYFLIYRKGHAAGPQPTLLYAYGGFEISQSPYYLATIGKTWLDRGGVYAVANIRGGGEYGPRWHKAALKENRQKAFDDFAAVAKDLIARGVTSAERLGIQGGSNGGLLMGVEFTQHPELYKAVLCQVPLLDMLRYHKLLAGHSWMAEYGDPDDPKMRPILAGYSPFHNIKLTRQYPEVFFMTSTADDRVHPGHARKTAARMEAMGHPVLYFEKIEGGHGAAANLEQRVEQVALQSSYLFEKLMPAAAPPAGSK